MIRLGQAQALLEEFLDPRNPGAMEAIATLALAEEQRTANLIAYLGSPAAEGESRTNRSWVSQEIKSRLGVHRLGDLYR